MSVHMAGIIRGRRANLSNQTAQGDEEPAKSPVAQGDHCLDELSMMSIGSEAPSESLLSTLLRSSDRPKQPKPLVRPTIHLTELSSTVDIERCVNGESKEKVLDKLEQEWKNISENFNDVMNHLQECCDQVTCASNDCLQSLVDSVETSCDLVDQEVKALYHLMTKCDELTTKLSIATSFREEVRALKNSVDTLEALYKSSTKPNKSTISLRSQFSR